MTDKKHLTHDELLAGVNCVSLINEPIDFVVVEAVREETATDRARRIWGMTNDEKEPVK
jgi:hypothetical protein